MVTREQHPVTSTVCGNKTFRWGERTYVMGVINLTPDSFTGDGLGYDIDTAVQLALSMEADGADIIDLGGESTRRYDNRPGAVPVTAEEELKRVIPVLKRLTAEVGVPVSIDTYKPEVARRCLESGASMINDVWGVRADSDMVRVAAEYGSPIVLMHNQQGSEYEDIVPDVVRALEKASDRAVQAGVSSEKIIIDPGIGFGKVAEQSLQIERRLAEIKALGLPVLVGPSRKSHIGLVLGGLPAKERLEGTAAALAMCIARGADIIRVHDVKGMARVAKVSDAIHRGWRPHGWGG